MGNAEIEQSRFPRWVHLAAITILAALLFALRLAAPPNLLDQDRERPGTYVLDVVKNGNWLCQRDLNGEITSKLPLYTWLTALVAFARGGVDEFALYLPGALSAWGFLFDQGPEPSEVMIVNESSESRRVCESATKVLLIARRAFSQLTKFGRPNFLESDHHSHALANLKKLTKTLA